MMRLVGGRGKGEGVGVNSYSSVLTQHVLKQRLHVYFIDNDNQLLSEKPLFAFTKDSYLAAT